MGEYKFELWIDSAKEYRWRFLVPNGNITAVSSEGYKNKADCETSLNRLCEEAKQATIVDLSKN